MSNDKPPYITIPEILNNDGIDDYKIEFFIWKDKPKEKLKNQRNVKEGNMKLFAFQIKKCLPELSNKIEGTSR